MFQGDALKGTFTGTARWVVDTTQLGLAQAWTSIILDSVILCYPVPVILSLHIKANRKIAIALVFRLGLLYVPHCSHPAVEHALAFASCCVAAAARLVPIKETIEEVSESAGQQIHSE
ncbi:hypothetical protein F4820DRAFT_45044 [Hypoxylon rubiginosum]|uniref:Uncharacterized protein n=1 Tax=Hypoxylon rubiginosum TaxID=110542 RepID=A0ACB9ZCY7_9PEZI|nr:hypothetical protein F4820DRAFT_45044 [Hypoxylon rubiginosum]